MCESLTLAVNDVNKDVNDYDGSCPADACTVTTTGWKVKQMCLLEEIKYQCDKDNDN